MTDQKPTGVFVRLHNGQLSEGQIAKICNPKRTMTENLLAIGMPVAGSELEVVAYDNVASGYLSRVEPVTPNINLVRQSDAQAAIATVQAENVRLREALASSKRASFNAGYLIACCNVYNMHNEEGIASDILAQAGITEAEIEAVDLSEYDAAALTEIRKASGEDPILKGRAL
ncbi:MAG: hypothetical protein ABF946_10050 [Acetobacter papayae]